MSKETRQIVTAFVLLFSLCSLGASIVSVIGGKWYSCRTTGVRNEFDVLISLWRYCKKDSNGKYICKSLDESTKFKDVVTDFQIIRGLAISLILFCGLTFIFSVLHVVFQSKDAAKKIVILQLMSAVVAVGIGISNTFYTSIRAQDIVGENVKYTFGWSCVIGWIGTVISLLNAILVVVLTCVHLDISIERSLQVRENLNMDDISMSSQTLRRMARDSFYENPSTSNRSDVISRNRTNEAFSHSEQNVTSESNSNPSH